MAQHQQGGTDYCCGVGDVFSGDVRRRAMYSLEDGAVVANIRAGNESQSADESGAEVGDDVAIKIFHQQHVVLVGIHDQLHAGVVHDVLAVSDFGILLSHVAGAAEKKAVRKFHDVGLMDGVNPLALVLARIFKGKSRNAGRGFFRDDLQTLHHPGNDFVLDPGIQALSIFADDDQIDVGIARGNVRQVTDGSKVSVKL